MEKTHEVHMKHVLLVDDDEDLTLTFKELLQAKDFYVSVAHNGVDALKLVMNDEIDVVLCDLMMPEMAGDMFYHAVSRVKPGLCERFIFITGYEKHPKFAEFLKQTKAIVLYKPVTIGKILGTMAIMFRRPMSTKTPPSSSPNRSILGT